MTRRNALSGLLVFLALTSFAHAQFIGGYTVNGDSPDDLLGHSVSDAGDVNGDGYADFIAGAHDDDNNGADSGSARIFSGFDGSVLYTFDGDMPDDSFGYSVSGAGDVNGDGYADVIVGAHRADVNGASSGMARVFSGFDGSALYTFLGDDAGDQLGRSVSGAGDVNGDGFADLVVGAPTDDNNASNSGSVRVFSGFDGSILYTFNGDNAVDVLGISVSGAGDVNNDGFADVIAGAFYDDNNGTDSGSVRVFSGLDGSILYTFDGDSAFDYFGSAVSGAGDVNADGFADVIVGAFNDDDNGNNSGSARVFSGFDGSVLHTFFGDDAEDHFGESVSDLGDVNGDGYADVIVGAGRDDNNGIDSGSARILSGLDGAVIETINGTDMGDQFGYSVSGAGDVNGDGLADIVVGAYRDENNGADSGSARVLLSDPSSALVRYEFQGQAQSDNLGRSVSGAGDVNADGVDDFVVGVPFDDTSAFGAGKVIVISGSDRSTLYTFFGDDLNDYLGYSVSGAGDVNGDGFADIIAGAYFDDNNGSDSGSARVFSGIDGSILYTFNGDSPDDRFGISVSGAGDVNGDGFSDLIVGAQFDDPNGADSGSASVFSGIDGSLLYTFNGDTPNDQCGLSVSGAGDVDGDGFDDVIVGIPQADSIVALTGEARVFSGFDGSLLYSMTGAFNGERFGFSVSDAGDVNSDGFCDFVVGAPWDHTFSTEAGAVHVYSGLDGSALYTLYGYDPGMNLGHSVAGAGDVNGDGFADIIAGAPGDSFFGSNIGSIQVFSGSDGQVLYAVDAQQVGSRFGTSVDGVGDVDGDRVADFIVGEPFSSTTATSSGSAYVFTSAYQATVTYGQAPQEGFATFDINNATNALGYTIDSAIVGKRKNGPYATSVQAGGPITFSWSGVPLTGLFCLFGPPNDENVSYPGVGQFDIGAPRDPLTGLPTGLGVFGDFNLAAVSFHHAQFFCGAAGDGFVSYQLSPLFIPGYLTRFQCVMNPNGTFYISNAVDVTIL